MESDYPDNVYWGDTHLHTNFSVDANGLGNRELTPDDAFRFAKGERIIAHNGQHAKLRRPLDFLVVADHAFNMGVMPKLIEANQELLRTELGSRWYELLLATPLNTRAVLNAPSRQPLIDAFQSVVNGAGSFIVNMDQFADQKLKWSVWSEVINNAERHNSPGQFTAFIGYEWSALNSLHRVVIFKDGSDKVGRVLPFSYFDSNNPEDLWAYFSAYEKYTSGQVLAIPHNSNLSNGVMFALSRFNGRPLDSTYAADLSRWEPLLEVTQIKGDSETHPVLSPNDEFADYETWNSWDGWTLEEKRTKNWKERKQYEYARSALKLGLQQKAKLGVNPFKFGMIGSTDSHTSMATADENNFWGKLSLLEPSPYRAGSQWQWFGASPQGSWEHAASGYMGVWAHENTYLLR